VRKFEKTAEIQPEVLRQPIKAVKRARMLRNEMSLAEVLLWVQLQKRPGGHKFRKQVPYHPITLDFACLKARLVIEVDGEAHNRGDQPRRDEVRDRKMADAGFRTLRLPAYEVHKNMEGCVVAIVAACNAANPPRHGEGDHEVVEGAQAGHKAVRLESWAPSVSPSDCHLPVPGRN
jgi:very-short-patch-repair endonuclease